MTIQQGTKALIKELSAIYGEREATAIADWVFRYITGWRKIDRVINKDSVLSQEKINQLNQFTKELMAHKPVQYVLNEAWFDGMKLYVDENVLIPRPETEELMNWALYEVDQRKLASDGKSLRVLDVGTGSGCIPIAIKKNRPDWVVYACDISEGALDVAKRNAIDQKVQIEFRQLNFLDEVERSSLPTLDLIVSNPPYISVAEKKSIDKHVVEYEPHLALFVPEEDSMIFYRALALFGKSHLMKTGYMMMEIHFEKADAVREIFHQNGYETEHRKDMHGNDRMIKVWK